MKVTPILTGGAADDSLLLCASDLQHSAIYDNYAEMQACMRDVADRIAALASTPAQPVAILFEHEDGRYAVNPDTTGDPAWHRLGPVDISAIATPAQSGLADAYVGAREDLSIWKRRALEAEATVRNFVREVNSSTFMGDPVSDECPHGDAHIVNDCLRCGAPVCCGKCCAAESTPTAQADSVPAVEREQERISFKDAHRYLDLDEVPYAWGRPMFKHSHVEASWLGWIARASHGPAPAQPDPAYSAACNLATALFKKYFAHLPDFASGQAVWGLCGSTAGVISQIDNMVSGLLQPPTTAFSEEEL